MTRRCHHEIETKPGYPDDLLCQKCQTCWSISECEKLSRKEFLMLPLEVRKIILKKQADKFVEDNPDCYAKEVK